MSHQGVPVRRRLLFARGVSHLRISVLQGGEYVNMKKNWNLISRKPGLTEEFIEQNANKVIWEMISRYQDFSEAFIERHADEIDWDGITERRPLSEAFVERHADKLDWY